MTEQIIAGIYEAAALPERWPDVLERLAARSGGRGGNLIRFGNDHVQIVSTPSVAALTAEFDSLGYNAQNTRLTRLLARSEHAGFLTDCDLHSQDELDTLPMYRDFLKPHRSDAGAATIIQGAGHDALILAVEQFDSHAHSREGARLLDPFRPHLARSLTLVAQLRMQRVQAAIAALDMVSVAAAVIDPAGRIEASNALFDRNVERLLDERDGRLHATAPASDKLLRDALTRLSQYRRGSSLPLLDPAGGPTCAMHLVPMHGQARDLFDSAGAVVIVASASNPTVPGADLIRILFDLTPAEARVARAVAMGRSPTEVASDHGISVGTVRSQLKQVFAKTGVGRQTELAVMLASLARHGEGQ